MSASVEGASPLGPPSLLLCLFAALREYRVLGLLGDPELEHALRGDRDRLTRRGVARSEEHTSELQSRPHLVCRLLLEKKKQPTNSTALLTRTLQCPLR